MLSTIDKREMVTYPGAVLQVVQGSIVGSQVSTTASSFSATGLTATIAPTSANSKILVQFSQQLFCTAAAGFSKLCVYRNGVSVKQFDFTGYDGTSPSMYTANCEYIDTPATTSSVTYSIYFNSGAGTNVIANYNDGNGTPTSTITLMEIAG